MAKKAVPPRLPQRAEDFAAKLRNLKKRPEGEAERIGAEVLDSEAEIAAGVRTVNNILDRQADEKGVGHLRLPAHWKKIPERADPRSEVEWVHSQLYFIVREMRSGRIKIDFNRASSPPPSRGTLQLLQYAIEDRKGFNTIRGNIIKQVDDEGEIEKRERMKVEEIREILGQFIHHEADRQKERRETYGDEAE